MATTQTTEELKQFGEFELAGRKFTLKATADKMKVFLDAQLISGAEKVALAFPELRTAILEYLPEKFLHEDVIQEVIEKLTHEDVILERRIAKGVPAVPGRPGKLLLLVKAFTKSSKKAEHVDPWCIRHFDNIEEGMLVARVYPPHPGVLGTTALGSEIPAPEGAPVNIKLDETLQLEPSEDGQGFSVLRAKQCGYLEVSDSQVRLVNTLVIEHDVDQRIGDIDFVNNVRIQGDVMKDFRICARNDIEVTGSVFSSTLVSHKGSIKVAGHVSGSAYGSVIITENVGSSQIQRTSERGFPVIKCSSAFSANSIDSVVIDAVGDVSLVKEARSSFIHTRGVLYMQTGQLIGGEVHSVCGVEAKVLGTDSGARTMIFLCSDIESTAEYASLLEDLRTHESAEQMIRLYLGPYAENPTRIQLLKPPHRQKMEALRQKLASLESSKAKLVEKRAELMNTAKHSKTYRVNFSAMAYPEVSIQAGDVIFTISEPIKGPKTIEYISAEKRFEVSELKPIECILE